MIDIIILFFLVIHIGKVAVKKGLPSLRWKIHLIMAWLGAEFFGVIIGYVIFGKDNLFSCFLIAIGCAATSYILIKNYLLKLPDVISDDDLNNFGR